jgi:putative resolvase
MRVSKESMWKVAEFGSLIGVSGSTLRRWETEGKLIPERTLGNQGIYSEKHLSIARSLKTGKTPYRAIVYCRVSSSSPEEIELIISSAQAQELESSALVAMR